MTLAFVLALFFMQGPNPAPGRGALTIQGTVKDSTGLPMAATSVLIRSDRSKLPRLSLTDNNGFYAFPGLWPGNYEIVAEAPDFEKEPKTVDLASSIDFNFMLRVKVIGTCPGLECAGLGPAFEGVFSSLDPRLEATRARRSAAERLAAELWQFSMQMEGLAVPRGMDTRRSEILKEFHELEADALPALILALQDPDILVRRNAALILLDLSGGYSTSLRHTVNIREALPSLISALQDTDSLTRGWSAQATGNLGVQATSAVPELIRLLVEGDEGNRNSSCIALRKIGIGARAALPALRNALNDPSNDVRGFARIAIDSIERN